MRMVGLLALALILVTAAAFADSTPTGATTTAGGPETATTSSVTSQSISAGQVLEVNLDVTSLSQWWAGFYGRVTESIVLGSGTQYMYTWSVSPSGYVYLASSTSVNWSALDGGVTDSDVNAAIWQSATLPSAPEDVASTFPAVSDTDEATYCGADYTTNPGLALTYGDFDGDGTAGNEWPTCLLKDDGTPANIVFKAKISTAASRAGFKGTTVDYQALVAAGSSTTYYFYKG